MNCYICKKDFESTEGEVICNNCDEAAYLCHAMDVAFEEWQKTLLLEDEFWIGSKVFVKNLIDNADKSLGVVEQAQQILNGIRKQILEHLKLYNKDELIAGLLVIKEAVRRSEIKENRQQFSWNMFNEYLISIKLIEFVLSIPSKEFIGAPIGYLEEGYSNFVSAICLGRIYVILDENIRNSRFLNIKPNSVDELAFKFIETEEMKKYFDEYWIMGEDEKPEDYKIENEFLRAKLSQEGKTPERRKQNINSFIKKEFAFTLDNLQLVSKVVLMEEFREEKDFLSYFKKNLIFNNYVPKLSIFKKSVLIKTLTDNFGDIAFDYIINTFSINKFACDMGEKNEKALELMSVYEVGELIIFGRLDFCQNISAFDKFMNSGHFIEMFKPSIKEDKSIIECQKKLSSYLAYVIADRLNSSSYKLPMERLSSKMGGKLVPRAEINKIQVDGYNILITVGDLDVLALDEKKKIIFLIEIKNYKPAIDSKELFYKDKNKIDKDEVFRKIKSREKIIKDNISTVVKYILGKDEGDYKVKSIFVTSRPNYFACSQNEDIEYISWTNLIKKIQEKKL
ncbi:hypothetical protein [Clostridium estertheticum]|uniref:NERD domain-containing protein n=1 Tax=Clostridium estertheticum subsp. estertheticum TaxID=1552 RepID=A0A1J0GC60_9CLOT|nr:hypothetical protein [Clostridium estertheticum]APC38895.1 hypothetical protein A7L45_01835 [Clostridium estertheticum subsp. estertheticum]MBZ9615157.1 hypothetical protein [Clostridium estertheticum subsp. laramiense]WAG75052.1 hypothetical protein LL032_06265 [Clostridium estertheticum]